MHLAQILAGVNWIAVFVATITAFMLGAVWYSKALFANAWMQEVGLTEEAVNGANMGKTFGGAFILQLLAAIALSAFLGEGSNWMEGLHTGLWIGLFWVATAYGVTYLFEQRSLRLWLINAGYYVVWYALIGAIIGAFE
jgi:hypothetical protein